MVARAASGDRAAWESLVSAYVGLVWAVARSHHLRADDAADVVQVTWLRLVEHLDRLQEPAKVGAWLATTARHESLRLLRRVERERLVPDLAELALLMTDELGLGGRADEDLLDEVAEAFLALQPRPRALMRLLLLEPAPSYAEIAVALDIPIGSIGPTRGRCLRAMRERLRGSASTAPLSRPF